MSRREPRPETGIVVKVPDLSDVIPAILERSRKEEPEIEKVGFHTTWGYVVKADGSVYCLDSDGVGPADPIDDDEHPFRVGVYPTYKKDAEGLRKHGVTPCCTLKMPKSVLLGKPITAEQPLEKFIRTFGNRLERNFRLWWKVLREDDGR